MNEPLVALLSDFGLADHYVGVVKAVLAGIAPRARTLDLSHAVPPQDVRAGAFLLRAAVDYLPPSTIILAVVDPGVGTARRAIAVELGGLVFVGPDNGLLSWAIARLAELGHCEVNVTASTLRLGSGCRAVALDRPAFWRPTVSTTFHGRDVFAPVAAHLAIGVPLDELGTHLREIVAIPWPAPRSAANDRVVAEVVYVDHFGNLVTSFAPGPAAIHSVEVAGRRLEGLSPHFQSERPLIALVGSTGLLEVAAPGGRAAATLGVGVGAEVVIQLATAPGDPDRASVSSA